MADPQLPAKAVQEAQAILQNPPTDEAQALAEQAQAPAQADEVSLEICKTVFSLFFATCFVPVFECLVCFGSTLLFCFCLPCFNVYPFPCGLCGPFCNFLYCLSCFRHFCPFGGFTGSFWFGFVGGPATNVCPSLVGFAGHF